MWTVDYYETENGQKPAREFISALPIKLEAKAYRDIGLLEQFGTHLAMPYSRHIKEGIYELRIQQAGYKARVFYFFVIEKKILLLSGFLKKTRKTPPGEIKKALNYKADYERRKCNEL